MMKYYSIGMKLNDVIKDKDTEQIVLENIRRCSKIVGKTFKVVFWHVKLTEQEGIVDSGQENFADIVFDNTDFGKDWKV